MKNRRCIPSTYGDIKIKNKIKKVCVDLSSANVLLNQKEEVLTKQMHSTFQQSKQIMQTIIYDN
jgi:hypothetical protein